MFGVSKAGMTKPQVDAWVELIHRCIGSKNGNERFTLSSYDEMREMLGAVEEREQVNEVCSRSPKI